MNDVDFIDFDEPTFSFGDALKQNNKLKLPKQKTISKNIIPVKNNTSNTLQKMPLPKKQDTANNNLKKSEKIKESQQDDSNTPDITNKLPNPPSSHNELDNKDLELNLHDDSYVTDDKKDNSLNNNTLSEKISFEGNQQKNLLKKPFNKNGLLSKCHLKLASYIEQNKDVTLAGTKRFTDKSGEYYLKNIQLKKKKGQGGAVNKKLSLRTPQNLENCLNKLNGNLNKIKKSATKIVTVLPENSLTPIPVKEKNSVRGVAGLFNKQQYKNAERTAVFIRRMEYSTGVQRHNAKPTKKNLDLKKIITLQEWWKTMFKILKLQKCIKGFLFRKNLMKNLEHQERLLQFLTEFDNIHGYHLYKKFFNNLKQMVNQINSKRTEMLEDFSEKIEKFENMHNLRKLKENLLRWRKIALDQKNMEKEEEGDNLTKGLNKLDNLFKKADNDLKKDTFDKMKLMDFINHLNNLKDEMDDKNKKDFLDKLKQLHDYQNKKDSFDQWKKLTDKNKIFKKLLKLKKKELQDKNRFTIDNNVNNLNIIDKNDNKDQNNLVPSKNLNNGITVTNENSINFPQKESPQKVLSIGNPGQDFSIIGKKMYYLNKGEPNKRMNKPNKLSDTFDKIDNIQSMLDDLRAKKKAKSDNLEKAKDKLAKIINHIIKHKPFGIDEDNKNDILKKALDKWKSHLSDYKKLKFKLFKDKKNDEKEDERDDNKDGNKDGSKDDKNNFIVVPKEIDFEIIADKENKNKKRKKKKAKNPDENQENNLPQNGEDLINNKVFNDNLLNNQDNKGDNNNKDNANYNNDDDNNYDKLKNNLDNIEPKNNTNDDNNSLNNEDNGDNEDDNDLNKNKICHTKPFTLDRAYSDNDNDNDNSDDEDENGNAKNNGDNMENDNNLNAKKKPKIRAIEKGNSFSIIDNKFLEDKLNSSSPSNNKDNMNYDGDEMSPNGINGNENANNDKNCYRINQKDKNLDKIYYNYLFGELKYKDDNNGDKEIIINKTSNLKNYKKPEDIKNNNDVNNNNNNKENQTPYSNGLNGDNLNNNYKDYTEYDQPFDKYDDVNEIKEISEYFPGDENDKDIKYIKQKRDNFIIGPNSSDLLFDNSPNKNGILNNNNNNILNNNNDMLNNNNGNNNNETLNNNNDMPNNNNGNNNNDIPNNNNYNNKNLNSVDNDNNYYNDEDRLALEKLAKRKMKPFNNIQITPVELFSIICEYDKNKNLNDNLQNENNDINPQENDNGNDIYNSLYGDNKDNDNDNNMTDEDYYKLYHASKLSLWPKDKIPTEVDIKNNEEEDESSKIVDLPPVINDKNKDKNNKINSDKNDNGESDDYNKNNLNNNYYYDNNPIKEGENDIDNQNRNNDLIQNKLNNDDINKNMLNNSDMNNNNLNNNDKDNENDNDNGDNNNFNNNKGSSKRRNKKPYENLEIIKDQSFSVLAKDKGDSASKLPKGDNNKMFNELNNLDNEMRKIKPDLYKNGPNKMSDLLKKHQDLMNKYKDDNNQKDENSLPSEEGLDQIYDKKNNLFNKKNNDNENDDDLIKSKNFIDNLIKDNKNDNENSNDLNSKDKDDDDLINKKNMLDKYNNNENDDENNHRKRFGNADTIKKNNNNNDSLNNDENELDNKSNSNYSDSKKEYKKRKIDYNSSHKDTDNKPNDSNENSQNIIPQKCDFEIQTLNDEYSISKPNKNQFTIYSDPNKKNLFDNEKMKFDSINSFSINQEKKPINENDLNKGIEHLKNAIKHNIFNNLVDEIKNEIPNKTKYHKRNKRISNRKNNNKRNKYNSKRNPLLRKYFERWRDIALDNDKIVTNKSILHKLIELKRNNDNQYVKNKELINKLKKALLQSLLRKYKNKNDQILRKYLNKWNQIAKQCKKYMKKFIGGKNYKNNSQDKILSHISNINKLEQNLSPYNNSNFDSNSSKKKYPSKVSKFNGFDLANSKGKFNGKNDDLVKSVQSLINEHPDSLIANKYLGNIKNRIEYPNDLMSDYSEENNKKYLSMAQRMYRSPNSSINSNINVNSYNRDMLGPEYSEYKKRNQKYKNRGNIFDDDNYVDDVNEEKKENNSNETSPNNSVMGGMNLQEAKIENIKPIVYTSQSFFIDKNTLTPTTLENPNPNVSYYKNINNKYPMTMKGDFSKLIEKNPDILKQKNPRIQVTNATCDLGQFNERDLNYVKYNNPYMDKKLKKQLKKNEMTKIVQSCDKDIYQSQKPYETQKQKWISMSIPLKNDVAKWEFLNGLKGERYKNTTNKFELIQKQKNRQKLVDSKRGLSNKSKSLSKITEESAGNNNVQYNLREMNYSQYYKSPIRKKIEEEDSVVSSPTVKLVNRDKYTYKKRTGPYHSRVSSVDYSQKNNLNYASEESSNELNI